MANPYNGILFNVKKKTNSYQAIKRHGVNENYWLKDDNVKRLQTMIPLMWHSGKDETMETVNRPVVVFPTLSLRVCLSPFIIIAVLFLGSPIVGLPTINCR